MTSTSTTPSIDLSAPVEPVVLGTTGLTCSPIIFGAMARRPTDSAQLRESLVREAIDLGLNTIDTAPLYAYGDSERWVGRAIRGRRDRVVIATKVGLRWDDEHGDVLFSAPGPKGTMVTVRRDARPQAIRADVEASLARLDLDYLDVLQVHQPDRHTPVERTAEVLAELVQSGTVRAVGVSNFSVAETDGVVRALGATPFACLQLPYSLLDRRIDAHQRRWAQQRGVAIWAYSPLAEGVLAKDVTFSRQADHWVRHSANAASIRRFVRDELDPVARAHGVARAVVALAWCRQQPAMVPIVGASRPEQVRDAARAARLTLTRSQVDGLDAASRRLRLSYRAGGRRRDRLWAAVRRRIG